MAFSARSMGHVQQSKTMISMARQVGVGGGGGDGGGDDDDDAEVDGNADDGYVSMYHDSDALILTTRQVAAELYDTTHFGSGVGFLIMSM